MLGHETIINNKEVIEFIGVNCQSKE